MCAGRSQRPRTGHLTCVQEREKGADAVYIQNLKRESKIYICIHTNTQVESLLMEK